MSHHLTTSLPSEFISNHKPLFPNHHHHHHALYDFASSSSTESDSDDDDLTRHFTRSVSLQDPPHLLQNKRVFSGSPESTLNWNIYGSGHTQVRSSPTTPFSQPNENSLDLIYAAAEQVARMKMNINMKMKMNAMNDAVFPNGGLIGAPRPVGASLPHHHHHLPPLWTENEDFIRQQQLRRRLAGVCNYNSGGRCGTGRAGGPVGFSESAWPHVPVETQRRAQPANLFAVKPVNGGFNGGSERVVKKERAGTGVFLPRNYCNVVPETKKKQGIGGLVEWMKKDMDPMMVQQQPQPHNLKRDELMELVIARRNAVMLAQQRRSGANAIVAETRKGQGEIVLPQEWTY